MFRVVKTGYIDMAHRIRGHPGKCRFLHGHTWKVEVSVSCSDSDLDDLDMVIDFSDLKKIFFHWLDVEFDHSCILGCGDAREIRDAANADPDGGPVDRLTRALGVDSLNIKTLPFDITAETLARHFYESLVKSEEVVEVLKSLGREGAVRFDYVRVYESIAPNESYAEYSRGDRFWVDPGTLKE